MIGKIRSVVADPFDPWAEEALSSLRTPSSPFAVTGVGSVSGTSVVPDVRAAGASRQFTDDLGTPLTGMRTETYYETAPSLGGPYDTPSVYGVQQTTPISVNPPSASPEVMGEPSRVNFSMPWKNIRRASLAGGAVLGAGALGIGGLHGAGYAIDEFADNRDYQKQLRRAYDYAELIDVAEAKDHERLMDMYNQELARQLQFAAGNKSRTQQEFDRRMIGAAYG